MKKVFSLSALALAGVMAVTGCACSKEGVYKFDSMEITVGEETKKYTCSQEEMEENIGIAFTCATYKAMEFELKDGGKATIGFDVEDDEESIFGDAGEQELLYKIDDGDVYLRETEEDEWEKFGAYKKGKITIEEEGVKIVLKKD